LFASPSLNDDMQLEPTLASLQQRIGLSNKELGELVRRQPTILNLSIQDQLEHNISWLQHRLQLDQGSLRRAVLLLTSVDGLTQLLGSNMEEELEPTLVWLQGKLKLDDAGLSKLVEKHPSFLGFSLESHKERVACLQKRLDMDDQSLSKLVKTLPQVPRTQARMAQSETRVG
jgi:hypothetical protein